MTTLAQLHTQLINAAENIKKSHILALFDAQPNRAYEFTLSAAGLTLDFAKQAIDKSILNDLIEVSKLKQLAQLKHAQFSGESVNTTEKRAVLHTALRDSALLAKHLPEVAEEIEATKTRLLDFVARFEQKSIVGTTGKAITDVISIGIGGSFFGPKMLEAALVDSHVNNINVHYLANIDGQQIKHTLAKLNAETTLIVVASKSWTTAETQLNMQAVMDWFKQSMPNTAIAKHWVALTAKPELAKQAGFSDEMIFPLWDFIGGRYSIWSTIALPLALKIGKANFEALLAGAASLDNHFITAPEEQNLPVIAALIGYWQQHYLGENNLLVLPYGHALKTLPAYLQQLDMESNGKSVNLAGDSIELSGPILWGAEGTNCQHSFMQLLHQGKQSAMIDFILPRVGESSYPQHHKAMIANCLGQSQALLQGKNLAQAQAELEAQGLSQEDINELAPHKVMPGNKGSNTLLIDDLSPRSLGALLAFYEHKVFVQGVLFGINSYDQWGVELGKQLGNQVLDAMASQNYEQLDPSTAHLLKILTN
ncbi:glucose-6-phosphate isomerase [Pseudoalteromonas sp. G4]|uniref:glucose-6-phosphate isomerase n=1 Tax=Pseudoalteromonas sp. G4 TaxID=2992761 RepID=UPI00237DE4D3|nr:glucose-6-phosphate isomerase [Pseudoalteromonas sp. G4]MDE3271707.1 glucose-6-phosphate isomerase [Pseudoalteromonas sp. G4]